LHDIPKASMFTQPVYLDNNSTTACDPRVLEAMLPYFSLHYGNAASSTHTFGWQASEAVDGAREQVAALIGAEPGEIVFTSGATESLNLAIKSVYEAYSGKGNHIITLATEHRAVLDCFETLEKKGAETTYLPVGPEGLIQPGDLEKAIRPSTILVAVMYANNETGVIQPVEEIGSIAKSKEVLFLSDAVQAAGKVPVDVQQAGIDLLSLSAHKMYGPKGVGALYVRRKNPRVRLPAQIDGGGQEKGMRSGTLNVTGLVGFGKACALCQDEMSEESTRLRALRDILEGELAGIDGSQINGHREFRLPHTSNMSFDYLDGEGLIAAFCHELAVSSGSACTSGSLAPSHVLCAMGIRPELARSSIRFGLGRFTSEEEVNYAAEVVRKAVEGIRKNSPEWQEYAAGMAASGSSAARGHIFP
jgi:cysteine desulfurase